MSSSGLIYAVIVGAWAAYLVPMWLRRQDELNESRPTERFSTAIRLLAGRSALERRAARALGEETPEDGTPADGSAPDREATPDGAEPLPAGGGEALSADGPATVGEPDLADAEAGADPAGPVEVVEVAAAAEFARPGRRDGAARQSAERRARLLARRRRMVTALFLAFALGAVVAAVWGIAFIWVPALPAILLSLYIGHLRSLERHRYEVKLDRTRAAQAAERLRERERERLARQAAVAAPAVDHDAVHAADPGRGHLRLAAHPGGHGAPEPATAASATPAASAASALVEATEHEEWVDGMRERAAAGPDSWEPVPVPLPTYVTAPVAPRVSRGLDLSAPGTWDSGRPAAEARPAAELRRTPLFDQYADPAAAGAEDGYATRPRAANE
ncbi:gephyrin-like molybdotransferase receptor GlpR [Kitasatospora camelliae]|uniref:Gephyrin-like molybdotransferase receptor GlpR n=1 Tax=Kitasatospora camelliae TaxID=3156397 RepID=A0AAU8JYX4_9ACTN